MDSNFIPKKGEHVKLLTSGQTVMVEGVYGQMVKVSERLFQWMVRITDCVPVETEVILPENKIPRVATAKDIEPIEDDDDIFFDDEDDYEDDFLESFGGKLSYSLNKSDVDEVAIFEGNDDEEDLLKDDDEELDDDSPDYEPEWCAHCEAAAEESGLEYEANFYHEDGLWHCSHCRRTV